jgi:hypothetical protein
MTHLNGLLFEVVEEHGIVRMIIRPGRLDLKVVPV